MDHLGGCHGEAPGCSLLDISCSKLATCAKLSTLRQTDGSMHCHLSAGDFLYICHHVHDCVRRLDQGKLVVQQCEPACLEPALQLTMLASRSLTPGPAHNVV
jgi:hypothetical protein